ncbi:kinase-like protein [Auricularia subglabra TFB-10046 SS5]|nr:kinase-like protein [Auricularia subglabra TFB-10046 SS5]
MRRLGSTYSGHFSPQHVLCDDFLAKYSLDSEIGAGGYGFVLTARTRETEEEVAIKFVRKAQLGREQWTDDPERGRPVPLEVYLLQTLDHPGIISCLDVYEDEIYFYMVLELHGSPWSKQRSPRIFESGDSHRKLADYPSLEHVDGDWQSLHGSREPTQVELPEQLTMSPELNVRRPRLYDRRPSQDLFECIEHNPLSEDEAKYVFAQVVDAVRYLHNRGVVHRDIKDENILVDHNLRIKLIDFGSAVQEDLSLPAPLYTMFYGTPVYAASEILNHFPFYAAPAEIWTLGILLCNIVWGCSPFADSEAARIGAVHLPRFTPNARWRESSTSESIASCISLVNWCLQPNPARRPTIDGVANHPWLRDAFPVRAA